MQILISDVNITIDIKEGEHDPLNITPDPELI